MAQATPFSFRAWYSALTGSFVVSLNLSAALLVGMSLLGQALPQDQATSFLAKGSQLMEQRLFREAAGEFEQALKLQPKLNAARYQLAVCWFALGQNDESKREFEYLKKQAGPSPQVSYYLGRLMSLEGDTKGAIRELAPLTGDSRIPDADYFLGLAYAAAGDEKKGIEWLEHSARSRPADYHAHYRLARLYANAGRKADADREFGLYTKYRNAERDTEEGMRACSAALDAQAAAKIEESCSHLADRNDPETLVLLGQIYGDHGQFAAALDPLRRAVEVDPGSYEAWHNLGLSYFRLKRYQEARQPLERAVSLRPELFDTLNLLGATLYVLGDDRAALPVLERAHRLRPEDGQLKAALDKLRRSN